MGYSTTFRLKGEIAKQFQIPEYREKNEIEFDKSKSILNAICLFNYDIPQNRYNLYISLSNVYDNIKIALDEMVRDAEDLAKKKLSLNENNEIDFYGWQYSDDNSHMGFDSIDEFKKTILDQLFQLVVCHTNSRFDKEHKDFDEKEERVFDILNDIEYEVSEIVDYNFVKYYRAHPELADEDDGINHFFPKEESEEKNR